MNKLSKQQQMLLQRTFTMIKNSDETMEYGESMILMSGTQPEQEIRQILDEIDKLLAEVGIDNKYTSVSQRPATSQSYNPSTEEKTLKKLENGEIGIGIERIN